MKPVLRSMVVAVLAAIAAAALGLFVERFLAGFDTWWFAVIAIVAGGIGFAFTQKKEQRMAEERKGIRIVGGGSRNSGRDGVHIVGDVTASFENFEVTGSGRDGFHFRSSPEPETDRVNGE